MSRLAPTKETDSREMLRAFGGFGLPRRSHTKLPRTFSSPPAFNCCYIVLAVRIAEKCKWAFALVVLLWTSIAPAATDSLDWRQAKGREQVSADIATWDLTTVLENIASATGWDIYVEPDTKQKVSTKFKDRPAG